MKDQGRAQGQTKFRGLTEKDESEKETEKKMAGCTGSRKLREKNSQYVLKRKWSTISNTAERLNKRNTSERALVLATLK